MATVHARNRSLLNRELKSKKGHGFEANLAFLAMTVACLIAGGGRPRAAVLASLYPALRASRTPAAELRRDDV